MHLDDKAAVLDINTQYGGIEGVRTVEKELLPVCAQSKILNDASEIRRWWQNRAVSINQSNIRHLLEKYGIETTEKLLLDNLALSLTDCYWVRPVDTSVNWMDVSLFHNPFIGDLSVHLRTKEGLELEQRASDAGQIGSFTPAASSGGELEKIWTRIDGDIYLLKGNMPGNSFQQSLNEVFASGLHRRMEFPDHVDYQLTKVGKGSIGCRSRCFTNEHVELIPAWELMAKYKRPNSLNEYDFYVNCMEKEGIDSVIARKFLDYQTTTDFLITNLDRHLNNFGILRDSQSLKAISPAPIYDSGNSMLYTDYKKDSSLDLLERDCRLLCKNEGQMMSHVSSFNNISLSALPSCEDIIGFYSQDETIGYNLRRIAETFRYKANIVKLQAFGIPFRDIRKGISKLIDGNPDLLATMNMNRLIEEKGTGGFAELL